MALPLLEIGILLAALLALALAQQLNKMMGAIAALLVHIPGVGGYLKSAVDSMAQAISNVLGKAEAGVDAAIGASWHALARLTDTLWRQLEEYGLGYVKLAELVAKLVYSHSGLKYLVHHATAALRGIEHGVKTLEREWHGIEHRVKSLERKYTGIDVTAVGKRLGRLEREVATVEGQTIPAIIQAERDAQSAISDLYNWVKGKGAILGVGTLASVVAAAVAAIGNGWLSCKENPFSSSKNPCSLWGDLARLMPLLGLLALAFDFPEFVSAAELVATGIGDAVSGIEGAFDVSLPPLAPPTTS